jgi:signal transduction histidine kinase
MADTQRFSLSSLKKQPWQRWLPQAGVALGYALLVSGLLLALSSFTPFKNPLLLGALFAVLALVFLPLRQRLQQHLDRVFLRGERDFQGRLAAFNLDLARPGDADAILGQLRHTVERSLRPSRMQIFLYDELTDQYCAAADSSGRPASDLRFGQTSLLVLTLREKKTALLFNRPEHLPPGLLPDEARIHLLDAQLFVPMISPQRLTGWLALGPQLSGEPYSTPELNFLETLCDQAALAVERAQVAAKMENRAHEMTVLARLAQGINVTLSFDDILELIYAQSGQIIAMDDFHLLLVEAETDSLIPAFFVESDERILEREGQPLAMRALLEGEVVRNRKPLVVEDYNHECQKRGLRPLRSEVNAWMCVPLNAGAETIGALVAASRSSAVTYAPEQVNLFQAVADQAAGAIVKTRLLHEAERRARQLASLNEVTRHLTSTLELQPLLKIILNSAVDILNCEAGSLLLVDEQTDEMVFQVAVGPVGANLTGMRMPAGSGLAGKTVRTQQPLMVNNVQDSPEWFQKPDQQTGFITRAVLVTPLLFKDHVVGVIEVINRRDGKPFSKDDQSLLAAFASQAAIAMENARLYTMTDAALAVRVEELSVMQRIDRELNTSLDPSRAMNITLEWAMRQSGTHAGLVGTVQEDGLLVMAAQGYGDDPLAAAGNLLPVEMQWLEAVIETGRPQRRLLAEGEPGGLLAGARSQAALAIQREEKAIGILLLESRAGELVAEETLEFLVRLSDHASIAIANAQLYAQVQQANLAKSEFVSFVSHELKNPMTSVKGFTELLASGVVGPITEPQGNFLNTIRANVDRMNTLVSDLNDVSKIEVGRLRLDFKAMPLADLVEEVARSTKRQIDEKEQTLVVEPLGELPNVWADRTRLVQVLVNLISNANKYTEKGGTVTLGAEACENQWDARGARNVMHVWVRDTGIGISEADQVKIFQKFFRSDDTKTREAPGTGLGLNITRSLVEMQGGRIWFESEFRKGTTFHFTVPVAE